MLSNLVFQSPADLCDVISIVLHSPEEGNIALISETHNELWLPSAKVQSGTWKTNGFSLLKEIIVDQPEVLTLNPVRLYKIWLPETVNLRGSIFHCVFDVTLSMEQKSKFRFGNGRFKGRVRWVPYIDLEKLLMQEMLKSPEILRLAAMAKDTQARSRLRPHPDGSEMLLNTDLINESNILVELGEHHLYVNTGPHMELIKSAGFSQTDQQAIFSEFIASCFPCLYMNRPAFIRFMTACGWNRNDALKLFRAADVYTRGSLSYKDFLFILAATDPATQHGGAPAEIRCRYIFRYFDKKGEQVLDPSDLRELIETMRRLKKLSVDIASVNKEWEWHARSIGVDKEASLTLSQFLQAVGDLKFRGTSVLLRCSKNYMTILREWSRDRDRFSPAAQMSATSAAKLLKPLPGPKAEPSSFFHQTSNVSMAPANNAQKKPEICLHCIKLRRGGTLVETERLSDLSICVSPSSIVPMQQMRPTISVEAFNPKSPASELIAGLRYFITQFKSETVGGVKGTAKAAYSWGLVDPMGFGNCLIRVCNAVRECMIQETRMLSLSSPCHVMGDLHGNLPDLLGFERVLWNLGPALSSSTLLFLGDYVDRGPHGVEVVSYLFAYKLQNPAKVKLLRGNHEIRDVQKMFTFFTECIQKFGDRLGREVWTSVNNVFDTMPLAAVIDNKIFCVHGGIPPPWLCPVIGMINDIPVPLINPDEQSPLAWELLWNDPIISKGKGMSEAMMMEVLNSEGFANNTRRGTAHMFTQAALERFLSVNNLSHVIRAHEMQQTGFYIQYTGRLITVFTSSHYCGGTNEAACVFISNNRIRVIRVDND